MIDWDSQLMRALLFVPGSDESKLGKVGRFGADVIVIDLEDAVADDEKVAARTTTRAALPALHGAGAALVVRVNGNLPTVGHLHVELPERRINVADGLFLVAHLSLPPMKPMR